MTKNVYFLLLSVAWLRRSVHSHPLIQSVQPYSVTNYQQGLYQPSYSEAFIAQPSNIDQYPLLLSVQTPPAAYQQLPSLTQQLSQIYWNKLLSKPSLRSILDPNSVLYNSNDAQTNLPFTTGGVINNYIIVPSDFFNINETTVKQSKNTKDINKLKSNVNDCNTINQKKKKGLKDNGVNTKDVKEENIKTSWNFNTDNIKCFTPADVLGNEKYHPVKRVNKVKETKKQCRKESVKRTKSNNTHENRHVTENSQKCRKKKKVKVKKKVMDTRNDQSKEKIKDVFATISMQRKTSKKPSKVCKCADIDERIVEDVNICDQDINGLMLLNLLQDGCTNLENRHTRNSKTDSVIRDFQSMYPDLSSDVSKSMNWYMNDFYSPYSLQYTSPGLQGNMYPFDFAQMYQIPQYSTADVNKSIGNIEKSKNTRRKKKKKKKSSKTRTEKNNNSDDVNNSDIKEEKVENQETSVVSDNSPTSEIISAQTILKTEVNTNMTNDNNPITIDPENRGTETVSSKLTSKHKEEMPEENDLNNCDERRKDQEVNLKEVYETQIPNSVAADAKDDNFEISEDISETLSLSPHNQFPEFESQDELFNMLLNDYYPDFRADNHAYLVSNEDIDMNNIQDRYFYENDNGFNLRDIYSEQTIQYYTNSDEDVSDMFEYNDNNKLKEKDVSQEVVFRIPPGLDEPDFVTRKINKTIDSNENYYKHNSHEENTDFNLDNSADNSNNLMKTANTDENKTERKVETVFANSKVIKYGQEQKIEPKNDFSKLQVKIQNDGHKTIVIAKSVRPEDYW